MRKENLTSLLAHHEGKKVSLANVVALWKEFGFALLSETMLGL